MLRIAPSILSADFARLEEEACAVQKAGADWLHIDVMDGHFVPNLTIGPCVLKSLRPKLDLFFDVHLMISDPYTYAGEFAKAGADSICFHYEADSDVQRVVERIKSLGKKVGLAIKPKTPAEVVLPYLEKLDMVLVMTVEPGFGGQKFMPQTMQKLRLLRHALRESNRQVLLQVDGGIDESTIAVAAGSGADVVVAGSAVYGRPVKTAGGANDYTHAVAALRQAARKAP